MSEPTKVSELLKKGTKIVNCKSGNVYKIRKMPLPAMAKFFNAIDMKLSKDINTMNANMQEQMTDPGKTEKLILAMREVLPQCITDPKVSSTEPSSDTTINIDDLPIDDQFELFGIITDFSGFSADKMKENETFRPESNR
jgi:hypothetical protein